jgi:molecular chaperone HtpG
VTLSGSQRANEEIHPISLHVPGILRLLSEHLYSDPKVALREMIQNAHDSCHRRMYEDPISNYEPRIEIVLDAENHNFIIQDNGSGLTREEIQTYLATVGHGYTSELRERLQFGGRKEALELIGQFGLGLLSAFIVADEIELVTRSYQAGSSGWRWTSAGEETYRLAPAARELAGSTFNLHLKLAGEFLLNADLVARAIRTYADFLQIPIHLNGSEKPINAINAPWHDKATDAAYRGYITERFHMREPLAIIPLHDHTETVVHPDGEVDEVITPLSGVLFVPMGSVMSVREYGDVSVYIRRMFITEEERELLPRWAKFVRGVVDCPVLKPTVSREQVRRDETFYQVQNAIEQQLIDYFRQMAASAPAEWRNIIIAHNDLIKGWALESRTFFEAVCDLVTFETSRGRLTMQEYLQASGGDIYYFVEERGATQEKMLYEARGLVVIDASRFAEESFLQVYSTFHPGVQVRQLEPGASFVFTEVKDVDKSWELVTSYFNEQGISTRIVEFEPASIPSILVYPPGSDHIAEARSALQGGEITGPIAGLVEEYLRMRDPQQTATQGILHLNAASPLMRHLLRLSPDSEAFTAALEIIFHNARFFAGRTLTPQEARLGFDMISYSVEQLVRAVEKSSPPHETDADS